VQEGDVYVEVDDILIILFQNIAYADLSSAIRDLMLIQHKFY